MGRVRLLPLLFIALLSSGVNAAEIELIKTEDPSTNTGRMISLTGEIIEGDQQVMRALLKGAPPNSIVALSSGGGLIEPALAIGRMIREANANTVAIDTCASACGLIWLAGSSLRSFEGARIGFHAAFFGDEDQTVTGTGNAFVGAYLGELGYGENVISYATEAAPQEMQWLTARDAKLLGLSVYEIPSSDREQRTVQDEPPYRSSPPQDSRDDAQIARGFLLEMIHAHTQPANEVIRFVQRYYGDSVRYYGKDLSLSAVIKDKTNYLKRWPLRFTDVRDNSVKVDCEDAICTMSGIYDWSVSSPARNKQTSGTAGFFYGIILRPELKVLLENGEVLQRD